MNSLSSNALALAEGFGLALSPCILPILPLVLAGAGTGRIWRPLQIVTGFVVSFTIFALTARALFAATGLPQDDIQRGAFALLLVFGLVLLIPALERRFAVLTGTLAGKAQEAGNGRFAAGPLGGFLIGGLIGLVWTPCAGPLLAAALVQVIQDQTDTAAASTLFFFSAGAGIPMLILAYAGRSLAHYVGALARRSETIRRALGAVMAVFAAFGLFGLNVGEWTVTPAGAAEPAMQLSMGLPHPYPAPRITGISAWLNSPPLSPEQLKGKVVLIDFWTYSCINCIRTLPYLKDWYAKYAKDGLVIIGVHAPEFAFEGERANVEKAITKFGIRYPVAMDNRLATWRVFQNRYWPAHYLIDRRGAVVYTHFGEGDYDVTEHNIRVLLGQKGPMTMMPVMNETSPLQTPETYLGRARAERESGSLNPPLNYWSLTGNWNRKDEYIEASAPGASLTLHYMARKVFLVMVSADGNPKTLDIREGGKARTLVVTDSRLYDIVEASAFEDGVVRLTAHEAGLRLYAFTFGG